MLNAKNIVAKLFLLFTAVFVLNSSGQSVTIVSQAIEFNKNTSSDTELKNVDILNEEGLIQPSIEVSSGIRLLQKNNNNQKKVFCSNSETDFYFQTAHSFFVQKNTSDNLIASIPIYIANRSILI